MTKIGETITFVVTFKLAVTEGRIITSCKYTCVHVEVEHFEHKL